jgi:hypothetical protein
MICLPVILYFAGCSSSKEVSEESEKEIKEEVIPPKIYKPLEVREREYIKSTRIEVIDKLSFDYNNEGKLINREKLSTVKYNNNGFVEETITYTKDGKEEFIYKYEYDNKGFRTATIRYDNKNTPLNRYTYEYDNQGNKIKSTRYDNNGNLEKYYVYENDEDGNLNREIWYDKNGDSELTIEYDYDSFDRKESITTYGANEKFISKYEFKYDEAGNIIEEIRFDDSNTATGIIQYVYKYY